MSSPAPSRSSVLRLLLLVVFLCLIAGGVYAYFYLTNQPPAPPDERIALRGYVQMQEQYGKLAKEYTDANGDLVADAPTDGKFQDPKELIFTEVAGDDPEKLAQVWEPFRKHLEAKTGLPVKCLTHLAPPPTEAGPGPAGGDPVDPRDDNAERGPPQPVPLQSYTQQIELLREGKLHIAAFSTGQVPLAVNAVGFQPLYAPATKDGNFSYDMVILVPADSPIRSVAELKGKTLAFVSLSSNSGGKAPIVRLREKFGLQVLKDYQYIITGSHDIAIQGVCVGRDAAPLLASPRTSAEVRAEITKKPGAQFDAACVAGDLLARLVGSGAVKPEQFRVLHQEGPFPSLCFGTPHNLRPELVAKIKDAFETFPFEGNSVGEKYRGAARVKFVPVDYRKDWKVVREIDEQLPAAVEGK